MLLLSFFFFRNVHFNKKMLGFVQLHRIGLLLLSQVPFVTAAWRLPLQLRLRTYTPSLAVTVPGPSRPVTVTVPGPSRPVTVTVPGPSRPVTVTVPGPSRPVTVTVPGPSRAVTVTVPSSDRPVSCAPGVAGAVGDHAARGG